MAKRDRHMQLINSTIYDKEAQARTKALEETRRLKAQRRTQVEEAKILRYAQGAGSKFPASVTTHGIASSQPSASYQISVNDIPFRIARGGSKLIRLSRAIPSDVIMKQGAGLPFEIDDPKTANNTPKRATVAGVYFVRSKNGNLHRLGAVTSKRWESICQYVTEWQQTHDDRNPATFRKKNELCKRFTTTGTMALFISLEMLDGFGLAYLLSLSLSLS